ncbi:MAG: CHAT domain-containing protein [Nitrososphaera sp.]|nr:CHAT domain-containing protein [Nitrososphaera sp.]
MASPSFTPEQVLPYLELAGQLAAGHLTETRLFKLVHSLPTPSQALLEYLAGQANEASLRQPRRGWAIAVVTDRAARKTGDRFLQALAAWQLARAANEWARPAWVVEAISRARAGFEALEEPGWIPACDWQLNALPWTRPNFNQAGAALEQAQAELIEANRHDFVPHCRLALAYAQLLTANFEAALENVAASEATFAADGDRLNEGRCWLTQASVLRRQGHFAPASSYLHQALALFNQLPAPVEAAKTHYQLAYCYLFSQNDYTTAERHFRLANEIFDEHDVPLWTALCEHGLSQVYLDSGRVTVAGQVLAQVRRTLEQYRVVGAQGDALFDSAKYERLAGQYERSIDNLQEAERLYTQVGAPLMAALAAMHLGSTYHEYGRYQLALHHLERSRTLLQQVNSPGRLAECDMRLANVWLALNQPEEASICLQRAATYYEKEERPAYLATVYSRQARIAIRKQADAQALPLLQKALTIAKQGGLQPQIALTKRILGESLCATGEYHSGQEYLQQAATAFRNMHMVFDQATCQINLGSCLAHMGQIQAAQIAWQEALNLNQGMVPFITWQSHAGVAQLAQSRGHVKEALAHYRLMVEALSQQKRDFWQPELAGPFLHQPAVPLAQAIALAITHHANDDALQFMEAGKAQTVIQRIIRTPSQTSTVERPLDLMAAEMTIRRQYERIYATYSPDSSWRWEEITRLTQQLSQAIETYHVLLSRWERHHAGDVTPGKVVGDFDLARFRQLASAELGTDWVALDYYLTDTRLYGVMVTVDACHVWQQPIPGRVTVALELCTRAGRSQRKPTNSDLEALGRWLLPEAVTQRLTPDTYLLLAPHEKLHQLPWATLVCGKLGQPLVTMCRPVVVPSLHVLALLWEQETASLPREDGLIVGVSHFPKQKMHSLPQVEVEVAGLVSQIGTGSCILVNEEATWDNLHSLSVGNGLMRFSFCHVASHAFYDSLKGRLNGVSLYDRDVWADQLWDCMPWPQLVTMSGCNSGQSLIYEGDEHASLATTFLAGGAHTVVSSLWPILDEAATNLLIDFYTHFLAGKNPAQALALAQRRALNEGHPITHWGSFLCLGRP